MNRPQPFDEVDVGPAEPPSREERESRGQEEPAVGHDELAVENERLRARLAALESELVDVQARANAAVADAQERAYWLDRWHIDLNALMRRPSANELRMTLRAIRAVVRKARRLGRSLKRT